MRFEVKKCSYDELPEELKKDASNNGCSAEDAGYLLILNKGKVLHVFSDAMEPEDARFSRDLSWIKKTIEEAHQIGYNEGQNDKTEEVNEFYRSR